MAGELDVRDVSVVYSSQIWRLTKKNIAVATGITGDGRHVQGIGTSRWSGDTAMDGAIENLKENARTRDFSFQIVALEGGYANVRIEFLDEQGIYRTTGSTRGLTANKRVEVNASKEGRSVSANNDESGFSLENVGFGRRDWSEMLDGALDSAESRLDRVGTTSV
ncbi:hypothetical protein B4589_005665 [Halolamina sp. CBA1230]|uniref:hypothetical protein n=1 Tax=Halolamina sp. CBA1230 TaxID=1853690 RepID=UPI00117A5164|nr:hypothetical protein [Halolamina sp. CBA1230]QKY19892.1 hypothetical protein B4589_005665 [Halolamina sp. CBA1230]